MGQRIDHIQRPHLTVHCRAFFTQAACNLSWKAWKQRLGLLQQRMASRLEMWGTGLCPLLSWQSLHRQQVWQLQLPSSRSRQRVSVRNHKPYQQVRRHAQQQAQQQQQLD